MEQPFDIPKVSRMESEVNLPVISPFVSVGSCLFIAILYVASLYVWTYEHSRDHPTTVKKRFCSVTVVMLVSPIFVYTFSSKDIFHNLSLLELMGFRKSGLLPAVTIPLLHTIILFLGPITLQISNGVWKQFIKPKYWFENWQDLIWLRNHVVAPFSEEFTFRACMLPLLMQSFNPLKAVFITPLIFGVAHFHHMFERLKSGMELKTVIIVSCFQFTYTTIFGFYSAYLFARTGHFVAPFVAHAFCNHMGFPDIRELIKQQPFKRNSFIFLYILGLACWIILMPVLTNPSWYSNNFYWNR